MPDTLAPNPGVALRCMEVWGGNNPADTAIVAPGIDAWLHSRVYQGDAAGGDIHYVSNCAAGIITRFAIADVAGHGEAASAMALQLRALMRRSINTPDQTRLARALNTSFSTLATQGRFATALLATYHTPTDQLVVCNAGHPRPLWFRADRDEWEILDERAQGVGAPGTLNLPLGVIEPTTYSQFSVRLSPGDYVVMYTDGLAEAMSPARVQLGEEGLLALARVAGGGASGARGVCEAIMEGVARHGAGAASADDLTLLVVRHTGENPAPMKLRDRARVTARMLGITR
jgi:serine phosphatase RsbU (regulator of sigma subunit)